MHACKQAVSRSVNICINTPALPLILVFNRIQSPTLAVSMITDATLTAPCAVHRRKVCVTGSSGFIGSWVVKLLLERGYTVHGTVRNLDERKNKHLKEMEGATDRLVLYKADMLDLESLRSAIDGCEGVFHTASPITNDPELMVQPAVEGAKNVIRVAAEAAVRRVVFTSSIGTVTMDPNRGDDVIVDESCWSDLEFCKQNKQWYCYGKVLAEQASWELARSLGVDLVVVIPSFVFGPLLQPTVNASTFHMLNYVDGSGKTYPNAVQAYVHVHDVAEAHICIYEAPTAAGRYLCAESVLHREDFVRMLTQLFPGYPIVTKCSDEINPKKKAYKFSNKKLKELGMEFIPVAQALHETVRSLQEKGLMPIVTGRHASLPPLRSHL